MPRDPEKARARQRRSRARKHAERFGPDAGDQRGRHENHRRGADHPKWNSDKIINDDGYVKLRVGVGHPLADPNGYTYEHLVVWVAAGREPPPAGFVLHHKNEVKNDNRIDNLEIKSRGDHNAEHLAERGRDDHGRLLPKEAGREFPT